MWLRDLSKIDVRCFSGVAEQRGGEGEGQLSMQEDGLALLTLGEHFLGERARWNLA